MQRLLCYERSSSVSPFEEDQRNSILLIRTSRGRRCCESTVLGDGSAAKTKLSSVYAAGTHATAMITTVDHGHEFRSVVDECSGGRPGGHSGVQIPGPWRQAG